MLAFDFFFHSSKAYLIATKKLINYLKSYHPTRKLFKARTNQAKNGAIKLDRETVKWVENT